jgi:hypothetical protein
MCKSPSTATVNSSDELLNEVLRKVLVAGTNAELRATDPFSNNRVDKRMLKGRGSFSMRKNENKDCKALGGC